MREKTTVFASPPLTAARHEALSDETNLQKLCFTSRGEEVDPTSFMDTSAEGPHRLALSPED